MRLPVTMITVPLFILLLLVTVLTSTNEINVVADTPAPIVTPLEGKEVEVVVTGYSSVESCHYRTSAGCLTASQKIAADGMVACPRDYPFGTLIVYQGRTYSCQDRYAMRLDRMRKVPTIDIWFGYGEEAHDAAWNLEEEMRWCE